MSRAVVILRTQEDRDKACKWIRNVKAGTQVEFKETKRSVPQNSILWAMLTEVSRQLLWHGVRLPPEDWRLMFLDALKREVRAAPNIDGDGFVNLGRSTSSLTVEEMSCVIELIFKFGAEHDVVFSEQPDPPPMEER